MNEASNYFDDDGTPLNPNLFPKPALCLSCKLKDDPNEEILCNMNRLDQRGEKEFICHAFQNMYEKK